MKGALKRLRRAFRRDEGTASIEFVLTVPFLLMIFMASFESGLLMVRSIMLERSVDLAMRELRLGRLGEIDHAGLRQEICRNTVIFENCEGALLIDLRPINTLTWVMPNEQTECIDRVENIEPVTTFTLGTDNEIMLVRVCVVLDAIFPTTGIGLRLRPDARGGYALVTASAFVNEP